LPLWPVDAAQPTHRDWLPRNFAVNDDLRDNQPMIALSTTWIYEKLGARYPSVFLSVELMSAFFVTAGTVGLISLFYDASAAEIADVMAVSLILTAFAVAAALYRALPRLRPITEWIGGRRDPESTAQAWAAAVGMPLQLIRRDAIIPILGVVPLACIAGILILDLDWLALLPLLATSLVAVGYGGILHYLVVEAGMRPVLVDINQEVSPRLEMQGSALPIRVRLLAALPLINVITGLVVAALTGGSDGNAGLGIAVLVAVGVATTISLELTIMLSKSILRPLADLQRATDQVAMGNYDVAVPVTTGDELGELAASFNQMVKGLSERERIREAFGTYLDKEVADYILSDGFSETGFEAEVSILFCDVKDFSGYAAGAEARDVVRSLNELFEVVVPVIAAEGGHVDKFEGDGLMAVFGAPQRFGDHADRAVRAAAEIDRRVNLAGEGGPFELGIGVNTGAVLAGSVGGGGRLNFSVIGDAVNIAARVEEETRSTGHSVLITEATRSRLGPDFVTEACGERSLKGIERPILLHVVSSVGAAKAASGAAAATSAAALRDPASRPAPTSV